MFLLNINTYLNRDAAIPTLNVANIKTDIYKHKQNYYFFPQDLVAFLADMGVHTG
jgi:hypothetical protein